MLHVPEGDLLFVCVAYDHLLFNLGNAFVGSSRDFKELGQAKPAFAMTFREEVQSLRWIS